MSKSPRTVAGVGLACAAASFLGLAPAPRALAAPDDARDRRWLRLLHYDGDADGGSAVVSPEFFLSPKGASDPRAELEAAVAAMALPADGKLRGNRHALCRFPARAEFLFARGLLDRKTAPMPRCSAYLRWLDATGAESAGEVAVLFAGYAADDPVGRLGHLFLRIGARTGRGTPLDLTVNYAINFPVGSGSLAKIAGSFLERFDSSVRMRPFYVYLDGYGNKDLRDIWQYTLALDDAERRQLLAHLWELRRDARLSYALLSQNCVTFLLSLIEVARPTLDLQASAGRGAFPSDAVKALASTPGLVTRVDYSPSGARLFDDAYLALTNRQRRAFEAAVAAKDIKPAEALDVKDRPAVYRALDTHLLLAIRKALDDKEAAQVKGLRRFRLKALARLKAPAAVPVVRDKPGPELGHGIRRWAVAGGISGSERFLQTEYRLLMHGRLDRDEGFERGDHFEGFDLRLRVLLGGAPRVQLDELILLNIEYLPSVAAREREWARQLRIGVIGRGDPALYVRQAAGAAWVDARRGVVFAHATAGYYAVAGQVSEIRPSVETALMLRPAPYFGVDVGVEYRPRIMGGYRRDGRAWGELRWAPATDVDVGFRGEREVVSGRQDLMARLHWFY